ncbi:hypothetical protein FEDK69T_04030 [Flavobacterium enshiense DK69]|uniref:Outer membrane protein beta-barrel domain-containing protein n=1 Tax=Flavobacterium enshiense DK69 TaxID=1107311 RepID=V6SKC5_9FLAO|nr:hypothetical protein [Flavobacterium enshiense]ESU24850.1 hypothetical protein FEDK69T_04030 [Flavobacterium enshiense DK69]KGO96700.1 hypothetical protein Q767_03050 [Flavobacterium enshiense DK69]
MKTKLKLTSLFVLLISTTNLLIAQNKIKPYQEGDLRLDIKLPHFNYLAFNPNKEFRDSEFGFNGYGLGFEYNYKDKKFIEANASTVLTFELPFPAPIDAEYNKILSSYYFSITDNFIKDRFTFGYGLSYSTNIWKEWTEHFNEEESANDYTKLYTNRNLALTFNSYYRLGKTIHFGLIYQPSLLNLNNKPEFIYEQQISLEINWRIKLGNLRKNK